MGTLVSIGVGWVLSRYFCVSDETQTGILSLNSLRLHRSEKWAIAFLGIRGFGSFYSLAYAQNHGTFADIDVLWQVITLGGLASLLIHGGTATLARRRLDRLATKK
ncbi:MAG: hypothetical protein ACFB4I_11040 [Cyanophyceae cyanobacterium]